MNNDLIVNVDEAWLKGKNRKSYYVSLKKNLRKVIKHYHDHEFTLNNEQQRFVFHSDVEYEPILITRICETPGVHSVLPIEQGPVDIDIIRERIFEKVKLMSQDKTFKVRTKRVNKTFQMGSDQINRYIAKKILEETHLKVDVKTPDIMIDIKVLNDFIFFSFEKRMGVGGLPVGTNGSLITLLSGGFDSPVASFMMSKRGVKQHFIFFHAAPYVGDEVKEKIVTLSKRLAHFQNGTALYIAPFGEIQTYIAKHCREDYRTLLFRKYMMDVSSALARKLGADGLLMGDALGQVSSQTMQNMKVLDKYCENIVMRPLIGFNKIEVIRKAEQIATFDISKEPHDDACSLFAPKHPVTRAKESYVQKFLAEHDMTELIDKCLAQSEVHILTVRGEVIKTIYPE